MLDDYMLGKDNTRTPSPLKDIQSKVVLQKTWSIPVATGGVKQSYEKLQPVAQDGHIYTAFGNTVQASDMTSGKLLWRTNLKGTISSGPALGEGKLVVTLLGGLVIALDQHTGKTLWEKPVSSDVLAKAVIAKNKVFIKTADGCLFALDSSSGKKEWRVVHGAPNLILKTSSSPVIYGDWVLAGFSDGKLEAIDIQYGHVLWQRGIAYGSGSSDIEQLVDIDANPIVNGNIIYLGTYQGYLGGLSLDSGELIWRKNASLFKDFSLESSDIYYTDADDVVWAIAKKDGKVHWKQTQLEARHLSSPVIAGENVVVADQMGYVHILSKTSGELIGRVLVGSPIVISPLAKGREIFILASDGQLTHFHLGKL